MKNDFRPQIGIYAFRDPISKRVMYVGQSIDIEYRLRTHSRVYRHSRLSEWLGRLKQADLKCETEILERCESGLSLDVAEKKWIRHFKATGEAELNISVGGTTRAASKVLNSNPDDWWQLASKVRDARSLLLEINEDTLNLASTRHFDRMRDLIMKWERVVEKIEREMTAEFPEWKNVSAAFRSALGHGA